MAVDRKSGYSVLVTRFDPDLNGRDSLPDQWILTTSPSLRVVETRQPVVIEDVQLSDEFPGYRDDAITRGYHTAVVLPLGCTDMLSREMVLSVTSTEHVVVTEEELDFLTTICHLAAIAVDKEKSLHAERLLTSRLERTLQINSSLLERVLSGSSMETIAGIVETILPDQLVILDLTTDSFYVSRSPDAERMSDREWIEAVRGPAAKYLVQLVQQSEPTEFRKLHRIDLTAAGVPLDREAYVEPLQVDSEIVGGLIVFPRQRGLDELDFLIAQEARFALSAQLMRTHIQLRREASQLSDLFEHLFDGAWSDRRQIQSRAARFGLDLSIPARLLAVEPCRGSACSGERKGQLLRSLTRAVRQWKQTAVIVEHGGTVFIHLPEPPAFEKFAATPGRQLLEAAKWQNGARSIIAWGPLCQGPEDYRGARDQCLRLLTLAHMFDRAGVVQQQDFGPFALLLSALDNTVMQQFVDETIGRLEAYDREHATDLLRTAAAFIDQACRYQATAEALAVHVSTLRYRLQRLQELFSLDLENAETRFALALALRLRTMIGSAGSAGEPGGLR